MDPKPEPYQPLLYRWTAFHSTTQITASFLSTHPSPPPRPCPPTAWATTRTPLYPTVSVPGQDSGDQGLSSWSSKWEKPVWSTTESGESWLRFDLGHPVARAVGSWLEEVPLEMEGQEGSGQEQGRREGPGLREYEECVREMWEWEMRSLSTDDGGRDDGAGFIAHGADLLDAQGDMEMQRRLRALRYPVRAEDERWIGVWTPDPETEAERALGLGVRRENPALTMELRAGRERVLRRLRERAEEEERERSEREGRKWTAGMWWAK